MKDKLNKQLNTLLDFYLKQHQNPPKDFAYAPNLIPSPDFFTVKSLQEHLNNPLLNPSWTHVVSHGQSVSLEPSCMYKKVQDNQLQFMDKQLIDNELKNGAAVILEGVDILDSSISSFIGEVENALPCALAGCAAFFSQKGNEAYEAHCDSDDVLVIQLSGKKSWSIYEPQQRRFANTTHLKGEQLGPKIKQLTLSPGDAMYLRAGVPHVCNTPSNHSLHLAFDLIDSTPNVEQITQEANKIYDLACEESHAAPDKIMKRYINILESNDFQGSLKNATLSMKEDAKQFRQCISNSSGVHALSKYF